MIPKTILDRQYYTNFDSMFVGNDYSCLLDFLPCYFHTKMFPMTQNKEIYQTMYIDKNMLSKFDVFPVINYGGNVSFSVSYALRRITTSSNVGIDAFYNTTSGGTEFVTYNADSFYNDISNTLNQYPMSTFILMFKLNFTNSTSFSGDNDFGEFLVYFSPVDSTVSKSNMPNVVSGQYKETSKIDVKHISNMILNYLSLNEDACFMVMRFDLQSYTAINRSLSGSYTTLTITAKNIARCIALVGNIENENIVKTIKTEVASKSFYGKTYGSSIIDYSDAKAKHDNLGFDSPVLLIFNTDVLSTIEFYGVDEDRYSPFAIYQFFKYGYSDNVNDLVTGFYYLSSALRSGIVFVPFVLKTFEAYTNQTITSFNFNDISFHNRKIKYGSNGMNISFAGYLTTDRVYCASVVVLLYLFRTGGIESTTKVNNCGTGCHPNVYYENGLAPQISSLYSATNDFVYFGDTEYKNKNIPYVDLLEE